MPETSEQHQIPREINAQQDARIEERTRIARELHDTLLQSFHGLLLRFQTARNLLPDRPADAIEVLEDALEGATQAIIDARDAIQGLRSSAVVTNDLASALEVLGKQLAAQRVTENRDAVSFSAVVEGRLRNLHPILEEEIYRIVGEALSNAFQHARAQRIEIETRYDARHLRVRVRDDGVGISASVLSEEGRAGHWGLRGMRERAKAMCGQLEVWSEHGAGTQVELTIPASVAYVAHEEPRFPLVARKVGHAP
jgi:signal transduction histidine kinase